MLMRKNAKKNSKDLYLVYKNNDYMIIVVIKIKFIFKIFIKKKWFLRGSNP